MPLVLHCGQSSCHKAQKVKRLSFILRSTDLEAPVQPPRRRIRRNQARDGDEPEAVESGVNSDDDDEEPDLGSDSDLSDGTDQPMDEAPAELEVQPRVLAGDSLATIFQCF
jgi:hypothetical protein